MCLYAWLQPDHGAYGAGVPVSVGNLPDAGRNCSLNCFGPLRSGQYRCSPSSCSGRKLPGAGQIIDAVVLTIMFSVLLHGLSANPWWRAWVPREH